MRSCVEAPAACTCAHIWVGSERTDSRNWDPDCPEHGVQSSWYRSGEQVAKRRFDDAEARIAQTLARLRREDRIGLEEAKEIHAAFDGIPSGKRR